MSKAEPIRILIADDHHILRMGLKTVLHFDPGLRVVAEAATADETVAAHAAAQPDVTLLDLRMPGHGLEALRAVHAGTRWVPDAIAHKLAERATNPDLSPRETEVLRLVIKGLANQDIAAALQITHSTAKAHVAHILEKLNVSTTLNDTTCVEAARVWAEKLSALKDDQAKLREAFRAATARTPETRELASLQTMLTKARAHFGKNKADAEKLAATGEAPASTKLDATEHAAWTTVCLLVLNLDETLNK